MEFKTADLCDKYYSNLNVSLAPLKSYGGNNEFFGKITTLKIIENNNDLLMKAIELSEPGSVIVIDGDITNPCAWIGDKKAAIAVEHGIAGLVINGYVRDVEDLKGLDIGILALGTHPCPSRHKANKERLGEIDAPLRFGGVVWKPGHHVYADYDGVLITDRKVI